MGQCLEISVLLFVLFGFLGFVPFGLFILQLQKQVSIQMGCDLGHVVELCRLRSQPVGVWPRLRHVLQLPSFATSERTRFFPVLFINTHPHVSPCGTNIHYTHCPEASPEHGHGNLIKMWLKKKKTKFEEYLGIKIHFPGRSVRKLLPASEIL